MGVKIKQLIRSARFRYIYNKLPRHIYEQISVLLLSQVIVIPIVTILDIHIFFTNGRDIMVFLFMTLGNLGLLILFLKILKILDQNDRSYILTKVLTNIFWVIFIVWMIIATLANIHNNLNIWYGDNYRNEGFFTYISYIGIYGIAAILFNERYRNRILYLFVFISNILAILTILEFKGVDILLFSSHKSGYSAIFHQFNHFGYYLLMSGMVAAGLFVVEKIKKLKIFSLISFCIIVGTLIINDTFGCYLGFIAGVIFLPFVFMLSKKNIRFKYFIPLILLILITIGMNQITGTVDTNMSVLSNDITKIVSQDASSGSAGTGRWVLWTNAIDFIKQKPWFGHGLDNLGYLYYPLGVGTDRPHNEYLQHAAHLGIPALFFYLCALASIFIRAFKNRTNLSATTLVALCTVGAYLVSAFFGNTMYYTTPYFVMLLGMATKIGKSDKLEES